jgi:alpha-D-xyloside xylohydrolase
VRQRHGFDSLPLLVRPGSVIPVGARADRPDYDDAIAPAFEVFGMQDGDSTVTHLYDDLGRERVSVRISRRADEVMAEVLDGADHLSEGWRLTWATGPFGSRTGATAEAAPGQRELTLPLG